MNVQNDLVYCDCGKCDHDGRSACVNESCFCCDIEDTYAVAAHFESRS
jgi:hypothetical protein